MGIGTNISEPFVLSTYAASHRLKSKSKADSNGLKPPADIFATHVAGRSDGYATITVQADGVHLLDVSTLHPVSSHTLGPSTTFSCPAVTQNTTHGGDNVFTTYAAIEGSSDLSAEASSRTLWMWRENLSSSSAERASQTKKSAVMLHLISGLHTCEELPTRLLVLSPQLDLTILDDDMNVKSTRTSSQDDCSVLQTFVFPRQSCGFVPTRSGPSRGAVVVLLTASGKSTHVQVISVDEADIILELGNCLVSLKPDQIANASCSNAGYMSILTRDGAWQSFQLQSPDGDCIILSPMTETFRVRNFAFVSSSSTATSTAEVSLLSLGSSHVLLAATTKPPNREIVLLLWDLQYSVLLASHTIPIPSSLSDSKDVTIRLSLVPTATSQALLLLSPSSTSTSDRKTRATPTSRSTVLVVPFTVPPASSIANAMGKGAAGMQWIDQDADGSGSGSGSASDLYDTARSKVLTIMRAAMEKNLPQAANVAFFEWEKREKAAGAPTVLSQETTPASDLYPSLGYLFVKDLLATVLQPLKPPNTPYSSEVVRYLLNRQAVSANMVESGLLTTLRAKNDWQSIDLALHTVLDLSETEIMDCLQVAVKRHRQTVLASDTDAMQVDSAAPLIDLPTLPTFLVSCVTYATTPAALRMAIRRSLKDPDDLLALLKVLEDWVDQWGKRNVKLFPSPKEVSTNEHGVHVLRTKGKEVDTDLPSLNKVLAFIQTLLDASFLTLLQHAPSHRTLRALSEHLELEVAFTDQLQHLRGPLEIFAKSVKAAAVREKEGKEELVGERRQRRKMAHEQAGMAVGLYRLEELTL